MSKREIAAIAVPLVVLGLALLFGSILLLRLFFVTGIVVGACYAWARLSMRNLKLTIAQPPEHLQVGDTFQREVTLSNPGRTPRLWLRLQDNTNLPGRRDTAMVTIAGRAAYVWQNTFTCKKRGRFHLGPTTITSSDPLGIFSNPRVLGQKQDITVYPQTIELPLFRFASFSDFGYGAGYHSLSRISPNASSVREYASGDSLHHIHWPSTARTGSLMVKMFDADRSYNASKTAWVLLDMTSDSHFGRGEDTSDEVAITIAASVVKKYVQGGMRVGLMASDADHVVVPPERTEEHLWQIMEALAVMKNDWRMSLNDIVAQNLDAFRDNPLVIIVATTGTDGIMDVIRQLRNRVDSAVVVLLDGASFLERRGPAAADVSRTLTLAGAQVYTVRKGEELSKTLDSKTTRLQPLLV